MHHVLRETTTPAPLSIAPSQLWFGNDGPWSPFIIGFGSPAQYVKTLISTSTPQPWVVIPGGCANTNATDCDTARGGYFNSSQSSTWRNYGNYDLFFGQNLGIYNAGNFGLDTITLGSPGTNAEVLQQQILAGIVAKEFFLATWGLRPAATNFTTTNEPVPSLLQNLKARGRIPSLSWSYTAGSYQIGQVNKHGQGSLTIGGYDLNRFVPNNVTFEFAADTNRDLVVALVFVGLADGQNSFLTRPILTFLDSSVSHIWLPQDACDRFQKAFGLTYNRQLGLYTVSDAEHQSLLRTNPTIAFTISNDLSLSVNSTPITLNLPYSAFDLQLTRNYPYNNDNATYYFPIKVAANESQYTLGRTFFQHAYVTADYERSTFQVQQATFPTDGRQNIQAILPPSAATANGTVSVQNTGGGSPAISVGAIAGIAVGGVVLLLLVVIGFLFWRRRKSASKRSPLALPTDGKVEIDSYGTSTMGDSELSDETKAHPELPGGDKTRLELESLNSTSKLELPASEAAQEMPSPNSSVAQAQTQRHIPQKAPTTRYWEMPG